MDPGSLVLLIPVLALATGFVAVLKMPRSAFTNKSERSDARLKHQMRALKEENEQLRRELADAQERLEFTEKLLETPREQRPEQPR